MPVTEAPGVEPVGPSGAVVMMAVVDVRSASKRGLSYGRAVKRAAPVGISASAEIQRGPGFGPGG